MNACLRFNKKGNNILTRLRVNAHITVEIYSVQCSKNLLFGNLVTYFLQHAFTADFIASSFAITYLKLKSYAKYHDSHNDVRRICCETTVIPHLHSFMLTLESSRACGEKPFKAHYASLAKLCIHTHIIVSLQPFSQDN